MSLIRAKLGVFLFVAAAAVSSAALAVERGAPAAKKDVSQTAAELRDRYKADLERLAAWCEANDLPAEAKKTRQAIAPSDPYKLYLATLPDEVGVAKTAKDASPKAAGWNERFWALRRAYAAAVFDLARQAVRSGKAGRAYSLVLAAVAADPDHEQARRLLGYEKYEGRWRTPYEIKKLKVGFAWSDRFGWLPKSHVARYEKGERYSGGRWMTAAQDAQRHRDIRNGWDIETEHYTIRTNDGIEGAVALGVKLERLHRLWRELFVRYYASDADIAAWFDGRSRPAMTSAMRHKVVYFSGRDYYNAYLRPSTPNIEISIGFYRNIAHVAYFFSGKDCDDRTIYHEATHQLFGESRPVSPAVGRYGNFWIVEGVAMYMESLHEENGYTVLGGFDDERMTAARYRLLKTQFYVPLGTLVDYGMERFQHDPKIAMLYSQSAGLTYFLICADDGIYRDTLVSYLTAVYTGRDRHDALSTLCGEKYDELDRQYREFLEQKQGTEKKE
jgi:hypothetical protein